MRPIRFRTRVRAHGYRRWATVIPLVAISFTTLLGFAALSVDIGMLCNAKAELQRTADAAAIAAAAELGASNSAQAMNAARTVASNYAASNRVLGRGVTLDPDADIVFGRAWIPDNSTQYSFTPTQTAPNAVRVVARRTAGSPSGPVPLFFANVFGRRMGNVSAQATAALTARDIVFVLDLSASHNDDSSLVHYRLAKINNREVWANLWDTDLAAQPQSGGLPLGPSFGNMKNWGAEVTDPSWDFANDPGLVRLKRGNDWSLTSAWVSQTLNSKGYGSYTSGEMAVINNSDGAGTETGYSSSTQRANYRRRVRVALGLDRWKSGKSGGQSGGNGDNVIDANEVVSMVPYPSSSSNPATKSKEIGGDWDDFIDYCSDITRSNTTSNFSYHYLDYEPENSYYGNPALRFRFGLKMLVDFVQDQYPSHSSSPGLAGNGEQPMGAVSDAVRTSIDIIQGLESSDMVGTAAYGTVGYGPAQKPSSLSWLTNDYASVRNQVKALQAGMWTSNTNIAQGIDKGVDVLFNSPNQRNNAAKVMILLTDGNANQTRSSPTNYNETRAAADTLTAATEAHEGHTPLVQIFTVSVGADSDQALMSQVAAIGQGEHFHAGGDVDNYYQELQEIFRKLGGMKPVVLVR